MSFCLFQVCFLQVARKVLYPMTKKPPTIRSYPYNSFTKHILEMQKTKRPRNEEFMVQTEDLTAKNTLSLHQ